MIGTLQASSTRKRFFASLLATMIFSLIGVARAQPDLLSFNLPVPSPLVASCSFYVTNVLANIGDAPCRTYSDVAFLLSTNAGRDYYDDWLDAQGNMGSGLATGQWRTNVYRIDLPPLLAGTYYLSALADGEGEEEEGNEFNNLSDPQAIQVVPGIDMALTELQSAPAWTNGENVSISCVVTNHSAFRPWDSFVVGFYLSTDPIISKNDRWVDSKEFYWGTASSMIITDSLVLPQNVPAGTYYFGAIVNDSGNLAESNEANNTIVGPQVEVRSDFDVVLLSCAAPPSAMGGHVLSVTTVSTNTGVIGSADYRVGVYLSSDSIITTGDLLLGTSFFNGTWKLGAATNVIALTLPTAVAAGTYYVGAIADFDGSLAESNKANNTLPGTLIQVTVEADMAVTEVIAPSMIAAGGTLVVSMTITNAGAGSSTELFQIGCFASTNPVVTTNDIFLDEFSTSGNWWWLQAGFVVSLDDRMPPGTYYIGVCVDWRNRLAERNETNNLRVSGPAQVSIRLDVTALGVSTASVGAQGGLLLVTNIYANIGLDPLPNFSRHLYLSADSNITPSDWRLDDYGPDGLGVGKRITNAFHWFIPANIPPGNYYIGFLVDGEDALPELNESDNAAVGNLVQVRDPHHVAVTELRVTGTNVMVSFSTAPGRFYSLERTGSLAIPVFWTSVAGAEELLATGDTLQVRDRPASGSHFYRVRLIQ